MTRPLRVTRWHPPNLHADSEVTVVLTPRQAQVLTGLCHGHTNNEIGRRLYLSEDTIKSHMRRLFAAMQAKDRAHAAALAASGQLTVVVRDGLTNWSTQDA